MKKASILLLFLIYLGIYGGRLALWNEEKEMPLKVFPYQAALYPEADREALRHGIPITSLPEYARLFEDYFS